MGCMPEHGDCFTCNNPCPEVKKHRERITELEEKLDDISPCRKCSAKTNIPGNLIGCRANKRIKELEAILIEYGRHSPGCSAQYDKKYPCRCGWDRERKIALKG